MGFLGFGARRREAEFVAYHEARAAAVRKTACVLCGNWHLAEDLTRTAFTKLYPMVEAVIAVTATNADDGSVKVRITVDQKENVLCVPVGALLALAEGGYGLQILDGATARIVAVTTGLFADGQVEVSGPDIHEGQTVGMAR